MKRSMALAGADAGPEWQLQSPAPAPGDSIANRSAAQAVARAQPAVPRLGDRSASAAPTPMIAYPGIDFDPASDSNQSQPFSPDNSYAPSWQSAQPQPPTGRAAWATATPDTPAYRAGLAPLAPPRPQPPQTLSPITGRTRNLLYHPPQKGPRLPAVDELLPAFQRNLQEAPPLRVSDGRRRPPLPNGYAPPDYLVAPIRLTDGSLLHVNVDDLADPRYVNVRNLNPDGTPVKGRAGLQPRALFDGAVLTHPPFYGTTYRHGQSYPTTPGQSWATVSDLLDRYNPAKRERPEVMLLSASAGTSPQPALSESDPVLAKNSAEALQPPPSQQHAPGPQIPPLLARPQPGVGTSTAQDKGSYDMPYWQRLGQMNRFGAQGAPTPPAPGDRYLELSPEQITQEGLARGASPAQIAADLQAQHDRLHEYHARNGSPDNYRTTAPIIDKEVQTQLDSLFHQHLLGQLATLLPRQEDRQELLQQLEAQGGDISRISPRYAGLADKLRGFVSQEQQRFTLPTGSDRHKINSSGGPLADYGWNETSNRVYVHLEPRKPGAQPLLIDVPRVTQRDVDTELAKAKDSAEAARQSLQRLSDVPANLQFGYSQGLVAARADANEQLKQAEARIAQLSGGNAHSVLTTERIMEEVKKPQYRGVIGDFGGWEELQKGVLDTLFALGAGGARLVGAEDTFQHIAEAQANLDTAIPGSTRADIEGGGWNNAMRSGQRAVGSLLPYLATGGALGLGGSAVARAGMAGLSGIAGAGQSMLDTRQRIQEVEEHLEQFPGDEQARLQLQHLRDGANLHALLSGSLSAGASLLPVPGLSGATRGILPSVARQAVAGTAQNVAQGVVQHGLIDPVRGDASDPFATVGPDTLFGLGGAIVHAGKDALSARWGSSAKPGQPQPQGSAPEPGPQSPTTAPGSSLDQPAAPPQGSPPSASLDPRTAAMATMNGAALLQKGLHNYSDWSRIMLNQHGDAIRPHLAELWNSASQVHLAQGIGLLPTPVSASPVPVASLSDISQRKSSGTPAVTTPPGVPMLPTSTSAAAAVAATSHPPPSSVVTGHPQYGPKRPVTGAKPVTPPDSTFAPHVQALTPVQIADGVSRLKSEGHAFDRHGPEVTDGQLELRALEKIDPMTMTREDGARGGEHKCGRTATQFTSERAQVAALHAVEASQEYKDKLADALQKQLTIFSLSSTPLETALGPAYLQHVRGKTVLGSNNHPTGITDANLTGGHIVAAYKLNPTSGKFELHTMYPNPP